MSLGLGLPFLLYSALSGEPTENENYETVVTIGVAVSIAVGVCVLLSRDDRLRNDAAWRRPRQPRVRVLVVTLRRPRPSHAFSRCNEIQYHVM